jgi:hypothetical protein
VGKKVSAAQAGFSIPEWVAAVGISRAGFYVLQPEIKPAIVRIGKRCLIIEAPDAWLRRVAETQSAHAKAA